MSLASLPLHGALRGRAVLPVPDDEPLGAHAHDEGLRLGDPSALAGYVARAHRVAAAAAVVAIVLALCAIRVHAAFALPAIVAALGAVFDRARGRLGATARLEGDALVVESGPAAGLRVPRSAIVAVGFGAPARGGRRAPETFWRGDFGAVARSHLVVIRLDGAAGRPRRLVLPEANAARAEVAARRLRAFVGTAG